MAAQPQAARLHEHELTEEEAAEIFDRVAQRHLHMSGQEFLRKWDAGEFGDDVDQPGLIDVVMLLPLVQRRQLRED